MARAKSPHGITERLHDRTGDKIDEGNGKRPD